MALIDSIETSLRAKQADQHPFAILTSASLQIYRFGNREDFKNSIMDMMNGGVPFIAFKYNELAGAYGQVDPKQI